MKKPILFAAVLCIMVLLISCDGIGFPATLSTNTDEALAAIVAATLTANSSESRTIEATPIQDPPNSPPAQTPAQQLSLDEFQNKEFVAENDSYSIYLINRKGGTDAAPTGELLVLNKSMNQATKMDGLFTVILEGGTIVYDDGSGKYVLLSIGTYTSRKAVVLSIDEHKQAVKDFCTSAGQYADHLFWKDHIIINNCDRFTNRPWGAGEAPSVIAINLKTGAMMVIAKSDLTHQFQVERIEGSNLRYLETYVENEADWINPDKQKTEERSYDLVTLSSGR
jgi:hypothetical protein